MLCTHCLTEETSRTRTPLHHLVVAVHYQSVQKGLPREERIDVKEEQVSALKQTKLKDTVFLQRPSLCGLSWFQQIGAEMILRPNTNLMARHISGIQGHQRIADIYYGILHE